MGRARARRRITPMKSVEFEARIGEDRTVTVPPELAAQIGTDRAVRVVLFVPEGEDDAEWAMLAAEQFLSGYAPSDAAYDDLPAR